MSGGTGRRVGAFFVSFLLLGACPRTKPGLSLGDGPGMEASMPPELRKAHRENDKAVMSAYGFDPKMSESEIVAELFNLYEKLA